MVPVEWSRHFPVARRSGSSALPLGSKKRRQDLKDSSRFFDTLRTFRDGFRKNSLGIRQTLLSIIIII